MSMKPEMINKIDAILERVRDPESDLPVSRIGIVEKVRYNEEKKALYIFANPDSHLPHCPACKFVGVAVVSRIMGDLKEAFESEFPELTVEFV